MSSAHDSENLITGNAPQPPQSNPRAEFIKKKLIKSSCISMIFDAICWITFLCQWISWKSNRYNVFGGIYQ